MVIGIDLDDTITNSSDVFLKYAKKYRNLIRNKEGWKYEKLYTWYMEKQRYTLY